MTAPAKSQNDPVDEFFKGLWWVVSRLPRTLLWVALWVAWWAPWGDSGRGPVDSALFVLIGLVFLTGVLVLLGVVIRPARALMWLVTPLGDFRSMVRRSGGLMRTVVDGFGLVSRETGKPLPKVKATADRQAGEFSLTWPTGIRPDTPEHLDRLALGLYAHLGVVRHTVETSRGYWVVTWHRDALPDPLADRAPLAGPLAWDGDWSAVPFGWRGSGDLATLAVANNSGTVVGGLPGGGKTAGLSTLLAALLPHDSVQFCVWDGKGGGDWSWLESRASLYNNDDEDRQTVAEQLEALVQVMRERVQTMKARRGGSSIWTTGGPSPDLPLLVLVVDECQSYLDATAIPKSDKEAMELRQRTEAAIATLVRKGRSAGVWVIPTTQKPTSDSLPTTIGANAASAVCLRVKTSQAEVAVLGSAPGPDDPTATSLPPTPGYAVVATENGSREVVRFGYVPEDRLEALAQEHAHLTRAVLPVPGAPDPAASESPAG